MAARSGAPQARTQNHGSETTSTNEPSGSMSGASVQLKRQLAGLGYDEQMAMLAPGEAEGPPVQAHGRDGGAQGADAVHAHAAAGTQGAGGALPYLDKIQQSFGAHDVSGVQAYSGGSATAACEGMGANAYATGNKVAFKDGPDLHTAAHEAAHVVQQRSGVSLKNGVGASGDTYEQHADKVADLVVAGKSAEGALSEMSGAPGGGASSGGGVQREERRGPVQRDTGGGYVKPEEADDGGYNKWTKGVGDDYESVDVKNVQPRDTLASKQYGVFLGRVTRLLAGIGSTEDPAPIAEGIWLKAIEALKSTQADYESVDLVEGSSYMKKMSTDAFQELLPKFSAVTEEINQAFAKANVQQAKSWGFWSGKGAKEAAGANCESSLEGGYIGGLFDNINISGGWDIQMWAGLSRAYATAAVQNVEGRAFHVYVGAGEHNTENIWSQVESKVVYAKARRSPSMRISVHAVTDPSNKTVPDAGGQKGCHWSAPDLKAVAVEPMRKIARNKANATVPTKKD